MDCWSAPFTGERADKYIRENWELAVFVSDCDHLLTATVQKVWGKD